MATAVRMRRTNASRDGTAASKTPMASSFERTLESHASAKRVITALSGHARTVARSLADSKDTRLPVDSVLDAAPEIDEVSTLGREDRSGVVQRK